MGVLYIVPTPIGNMEDITLRALRCLREVALIAAEDTRRARKLLAHYGIQRPLCRYDEQGKGRGRSRCLAALAGGDIALVSDAGTPALSDPGYSLIQAALAAGHRVTPLPGANAAITALAGAGLPAKRALHLGFLPRQANARRRLFASLKEEPATLVAYESAGRLAESLADLAAAFGGERRICVAREISKLHEEFWRGELAAAAEHFTRQAARGEITLVIAGAVDTGERWPEARLLRALAKERAAGHSISASARYLARKSGWPRREIYALAREIGGGADSG